MSETEPNALVIRKGEVVALKLPGKKILSCFASSLAAKHRLDHISEGFRSLFAIPITLQPKPLQLQASAEKKCSSAEKNALLLHLPFPKLSCALVAGAG